MEEEAEEQRRQRGENTKKEENKAAENATTFDMFATDADLPPEVVFFCVRLPNVLFPFTDTSKKVWVIGFAVLISITISV